MAVADAVVASTGAALVVGIVAGAIVVGAIVAGAIVAGAAGAAGGGGEIGNWTDSCDSGWWRCFWSCC